LFLVIKQRAAASQLNPSFQLLLQGLCLLVSNDQLSSHQGPINHRVGCTMGGGPRRQGPPINGQILPCCFDVRLKRNDDD